MSFLVPLQNPSFTFADLHGYIKVRSKINLEHTDYCLNFYDKLIFKNKDD